MGIVTHALLKTCCNYDTAKFRHRGQGFFSPEYPGETICTEIWKNGKEISFRCKSLEQDKVVINNGYLLIE